MRALVAVCAFCVAMLGCSACERSTIAAPYPAFSPDNDADGALDTLRGQNLQRTARRLADTSKRPSLRVLFYGQSISTDIWTVDLADRLRRRFPPVDFVFENRSIGGFTADLLIRTARADVLGFYPDVIVMHDLFNHVSQLDALVVELQSLTPAEIMLQTTHRRGEGVRGTRWDDQCALDYQRAAKQYGLELVDVRTRFSQYLRRHNLKPQALLLDAGGHLNGAGNALMSDILFDHLVYAATHASGAGTSTSQSGVTDQPLVWRDDDGGKAAALTINGNRIEFVLGEGTRVAARLDGRTPSTHPLARMHGRINATAGLDWPWEVGAALRVENDTPLVDETWTLTLSDVSEGARLFRFRLHGSVTGDDGEGRSDVDFVSSSGRVKIKSRDWWLAAAHDVKGRHFAPGMTLTWRPTWVTGVLPEANGDAWVEPPTSTDSSDVVVLFASGLEAGPHTVELRSEGAGTPAVKYVRVFTPAAPK